MKIWLYTVCHNEVELASYFVRHYQPWVDKIIVYDHYSTDGCREILQGQKRIIVRNFDGDDEFDDLTLSRFASSQYKEAAGHADWVIWVDFDEFVYHPHIRQVLRSYLKKGIEIARVQGYQMLSDVFPTTRGQIYDEVWSGILDNRYSKTCVFRPEVEISFRPGRHICKFGREAFFSPAEELKLLHFRFLGGEYLTSRHARNFRRFSQSNLERGFGRQSAPGALGRGTLQWFERVAWPKRIRVID